MNKRDQLSSSIWLLAGLFITFGTLYSLDIGTNVEPGPGFFPLIVGAVLSVCSLVILIRATFTSGFRNTGLRPLWAGSNQRALWCVVIALLIYTSLLRRIGFLLLTFLMLLYLFRALEPQRWRLVIGLSLLVSLVSYILFARIFQVQLPGGILGAQL